MRTRMKVYSALLGLVLAFSGIQEIKSQGVMIANADNFFVEPGSLSRSYLDVLANDYYGDDCAKNLLEVTITVNPTKGVAAFDASTQTVSYFPIPGRSGADQFTYRIYCPGTGNSATGVAYININDKPDVISDADCYIDPEGITFEIANIASSSLSTDVVNSISNVLCGDIDGDGDVEMLVFDNYGTDSGASKILVFRMSGGSLELVDNYVITMPEVLHPLTYANFTMANVNGNKYASVFFLSYSNIPKPLTDPLSAGVSPAKLYKFSYDELSAQYSEEWSVSVTSNYHYGNLIPYITDLMGDGHQQICLVDKIYDAVNGTLLAEGGYINHDESVMSSYAFGVGSHNPLANRPLFMSSSLIAVDIDNDGKQEVIGGSCVYKVNITNYAGTTDNTFTLYRRANYTDDLLSKRDASRTDIYDGHTALIDIDLDGNLEIAVTCKQINELPYGSTISVAGNFLYVYNPRTGEVLNTTSVPIPGGASNNGPSRPFVGDIDGDGYPEIALTSYLRLAAYKFDAGTSTLKEMWNLKTTDSSASTTLSLFDFAQSGLSQLIYRDETSLRIIDGREYDEHGVAIPEGDHWNNDPDAGTRVLATFTGVNSGTINEYPIVADVNNDGAAEIIVTGSSKLLVYGAAGEKKWAPARQVWNQVAYNPVYVNDDLTIPAKPLNPASIFVATDGTVNRPFNNFLQQATLLNREGTMITEAADLTFSPRASRKISFNDDGSMTITVTLVNIGGVSFTGPIELQLYASHDGPPVSYTKVGDPYILANASGLAPNVDLPVTYTIPAAKVPAEGTYDGFAITVNLTTDPGNTSPEYKNSAECHEGYNNRALGFSVVDGSAIICEGSSGWVHASPANTYDIKWYDTGGTLLATNVDSYQLPSKNSDVVTHLLVHVFRKGTSTPVSSLLDTIYVYRAADSLVWNNAATNGDWHDYRNWTNPADVANKYPQANIPLVCTNVFLPAGQISYPDLGNKTSGGSTDYSVFTAASCNNIRFGFGGELKRPDLLTYTKARVDVELETHRWYMFAPPLKNFYAGDFYLKDVVPSKDDIKSYTRLWGAAHPFGGYYESSWTPLFFQPEVTFVKGQGLGVWISDKQDRDNVFHEFSFPKPDEGYYVYYDGTDEPNPYFPPHTLSRTLSNRFIFDSEGSLGTDFTLSAEAKNVGSFVLVSNPFMSHLDFDAFYAKNSGKIKPEYKILNYNSNDYLYYKQGQPSTLTKYIAPMQSFLVEALVPFTELTVNGTMTAVVAGTTLRSTAEGEGVLLPITARQDGYESKTYLSFSESNIGDYSAGEDVVGMFSATTSEIRPVSIYSLSEDNKKMNLNGLPVSYLNNGGIIPLGIRTPSSGKLTINIGNLSMLPNGCKAYLYDSKTDASHDLSYQSMYTFENLTSDENLFLDNRFYLKLLTGQTGIDVPDLSSDNKLLVSVCGGLLNVQSLYELKEVIVYNLQGQLLYVGTPKSLELQTSLPGTSFYIVRIKTEKGVEVRKLLNQQ